ncbi:hypothetical protein JIG36_37370 [Actinoplanes sp. LDG1-06]|uniref:Uncharacterized protein n=1 Tax=Paractinoplanes ovalisporus TaxID=2810368 RepID=A0ABS2AP76_9ACTN|nr:hypothetical protein [Actinoplanes ovalisporus]MBM2621188.1 hypothetical protein [Actinoplanes ovalisporus]
MIASTWENRDRPVLGAIVELCDEGSFSVTPEDVAARLDMPLLPVQSSFRALEFEDGDPFFYRNLGVSGRAVQHVTGKARRAVGSWPSPEVMAGRLVAGMEQAAEREPDEENRSLLRRTAEWFGGAGRDVAVDVAAAVINRQIGGA